MTGSQLEGQTLAGESLLVRYFNFVKLPHTVFALPFALLGVVYASFSFRVTLSQVGLVIVAFTTARFAAMGFNRIVDRDFDAENPRTKGRELPSGRLSLMQAIVGVVIACIAFVAASAMLNPLCLLLSPVALAWTLGYSFAKRFTHMAHLWLGAALAIAPAGGYIAVTGRWSTPWWTLPLIGFAVLTWVAGFDMFYALQDEAFDRARGLKSAVVKFGQVKAILLAKVLHGVTIVALAVFGWASGFGWIYAGGIIVAAGLMAWEHQLVRPGDPSRLNAAFFAMNGVISIAVCLGAIADRLM